MLKGLIFDLDGVITDTAKYHFIAWQNTIEEKLKIKIDESHQDKIRGLSRIDTLDEILNIIQYKNKMDLKQKNHICTIKNKMYVDLIDSNITKEDILPGITQLLKDAKANNIKLAIASSSKNATKILNSLSLYDEFDFIVDTNQVKNGKPNPEIYLNAAQGLDLSASECMGFEDAPVGIVGLNSAKIFSVGIGLNNEITDQAKLFFDSTDQLKFESLKEKFIGNTNGI